MQMLNNVRRMMAAVLSVTICLTPSLIVSADGGNNKVITVQRGESSLKKLPLVYNDDYFSKSSFEYNDSLATASLSLELSGFANKLDYGDQAKNAKQALKELDFGDIEENDDYKRKTEADTIGVVVANKKIKSNNEEYTLIPVVIRGGGYENEWGGNAKVGKSGDHEGFNTAATKAKNFIDSYIKNKNIQGKVKLWIVGYSRGGATASLLGVKFNNDFTPILNELSENSKSLSDEDYYNAYVNKEKARTLKKYGKEIEINPNDLYVYTFEAPMGVNVVNGSGLKEYKGNIPCSKSEKNDRAIYSNIHNTINEDDFVTKVAPEDWQFVRPGVEHKLLECRKDSDIENMKSILHEFLINKVSKTEWDKKSEKEKEESKEYAIEYVGKKITENKWKNGINNYSEFGDYIIDKVNKTIDRVRGGKYATINMTNRQFFAERYQKVISKLAVSIMSNKEASKAALTDICKNMTKLDIARLIVGGCLNTNYLDAPINNIIDQFSERMNVTFSSEERRVIIDLLKGVDQNTEIPFIAYLVKNLSSVKSTFKMHEPELHLATLISRDKNKSLYVEQIKKINNDYFKEQKKMQDELEKLERELKNDAKNDNSIKKLEEEAQEVKKTDNIVDGFCILEDDEKEDDKKEDDEKEDDKKEDDEKEDDKKEDDKKEDDDDFFDVASEYSLYGINRALELENQQKDKKKSNTKGIGMRAIGMLGKGIKTGFRLVFSPYHETKNIAEATMDWAGHMVSGFSSWWNKK